ncbi:Ail/Lom family outer membrane beta-barrel protein [Pantoea sp. A4]|uniref:Ail/Lom family outer membrane beta-barrel protein n=1 Tax=Pantoea sp. A4 TaxID=1225184 RepID=UPI00035CCE05|nr:Ail/Lom family outer membrane beta-barrel protein [Pantoea sp. A4]
MKYPLMALLLTLSGSALAESITLSAGWATSRFEGSNLNGMNVKAGYQPDNSPLGLMTSYSYAAQSTAEDLRGNWVISKVTYHSLQGGLSYESTPWLRPYAMLGAARLGEKYTATNGTHKEKGQHDKTGMVYSVGFQVYPVENVFLDASYEGTKLYERRISTYTLGAGWKF